MRIRLAAVSLVWLLAAAAAVGQQQIPAFTPPRLFPPLEAYLEALRQQAGIPGMSAAIVQDGEVAWEYGFGFQNAGARIRATPDTPYVIGDASGMFAAVLLLQCVEQRRLYLDEPLRSYGVTFPEPGATLRQVLSHTSESGGAAFNYNPARYAQLTAVMEWCAPQPYRKSVAHRLLNFRAMKDSVPGTYLQNPNVVPESLFDEGDLQRYRSVLRNLAISYKVDGRGRAERNDLPPAGITAAGGLVTTVRDLARFDGALDSSLLLTDEMRTLAWTPVTTPEGLQRATGLGWFVQDYRGEPLIWQFGLVPDAYSSLILKLPARHLTFILLANSDGLTGPYQVASGDVTRSVFATLFLRFLRITP
jgi:CubicO group peptidase (beta-lactamase class C family)